MTYPDKLEITPLAKPPHATIRVPGSKSITNRALVLAALQGRSFGSCHLRGALESEDTDAMIRCLWDLGFQFETDWSDSRVTLTSPDQGNNIPATSADLYVSNSGTTMRFLTALVSLGHGRYRLNGNDRMQERPIGDLLSALQQLGVNAYSEKNNGCPPVVVETTGLQGGKVRLKGDISSQFLSGLLMASPLAANDVVIEIAGPLVSVPYVQMTISMMDCFGFVVQKDSETRWRIQGQQKAGIWSYRIEPDASAASYFFAAAAICGGKVSVFNGKWSERSAGKETTGPTANLLQGDWQFIDLLAAMGCSVESNDVLNFGHLSLAESPYSAWFTDYGATVEGRPLRGIAADMNDISDTVMTLAAVACFAEGPTTIRNVAHIRHKETDRLAALATELRKVGAEVEEFADGLNITPRPLHGAEIETYNDHRMAMSMALIGLKVPGIVIKNPGCVAKTYPNFWQDLERLRG